MTINSKVWMVCLASMCCITISQLKAQVNNNNIPKEKHNDNKLIEDDFGYTHSVKAGNTIYISGTIATGDFPTQIKSIMETLQLALSKYGATFQNVVKETIYTTNIDSLTQYKSIRKQFYKGDYPASSWVQVQKLLLPQFMVEIELVAVLPPEQQ